MSEVTLCSQSSDLSSSIIDRFYHDRLHRPSNNQGGPRFLLLEPLSEYMARLHAPAMATCGLWKNRILGEK